jgi:hypothetical protein
MTEPINWAHRDMLRGWAILAGRGHVGAKAVAAHYGLTPPAVLPPMPTPRPAAVPQAPRAVTPPAPQPATPVLSGLQGRVDMLQRLVSPPALPPGLLD